MSTCPNINFNSVGASRICDDNGNTVNVEDNALAVVIQDQHSGIVSAPFMKRVSVTALTAPTVRGENILNLTAGHEFSANDCLYIADTVSAQLVHVVSVNVNAITVDSPIIKAFAVADTIVLKVTHNMNVNGASTALVYSASLPANAVTRLDITGIRFHLLDNTAMDDSLFGGIASLTKGIVLQHVLADGERRHLFNIKNNTDFMLTMDNCSYSEKAPSGSYGFLTDWKVRDNQGVTLRLLPGEHLDLSIQDDLSGLTTFQGWIYGHIVV